MNNLIRYFIIRFFLAIPMVLILLTVVFLVLRVMPGDPASAMLGAHAPQHVILQQKEALGLNRPIIIQYFDYLWQISHLDLGKSMIFNEKVTHCIGDKLCATLELTVFGMLVTILLGVPLGAYAADKRRTPQAYLIQLYSVIFFCIPVYWLGLMLQLIFGVWLRLVPIAGRTSARVVVSTFERTGFYVVDTILVKDFYAFGDTLIHLVLPAITLGLVLSGIFVRLTRSNMLDVLKADYITAAEARGIKHRTIVYKHALKNAFIPILTMMGLQFAILMAGAVLTETTFSWPGMGRLLLESIYLRDYPTIQGVIIVFALIVATASLLVDVIYAIMDPRVRY